MNEFKRDYKKEWEKEKETKVTRLVKFDKQLFEDFSEQLKKDNKTINGFVIEKVLEYLNEKNKAE